jgi:hypothetical protein
LKPGFQPEGERRASAQHCRHPRRLAEIAQAAVVKGLKDGGRSSIRSQ